MGYSKSNFSTLYPPSSTLYAVKSHSIEIHYIGKTEMDRLRRRFALDHNPSVLSFLGPSGRGAGLFSPGLSEKPLGEIYLCEYYMKIEAKARREKVRDFEARLIAHGVLHLMGYDHVHNKDARRMESIERSIFAKKRKK